MIKSTYNVICWLYDYINKKWNDFQKEKGKET